MENTLMSVRVTLMTFIHLFKDSVMTNSHSPSFHNIK